MSWTSGGEIFDKVAAELIALNLGWEPTQRIIKVVFDELKARGWDTEEGSLGLIDGVPGAQPIVAFFNERGYVAYGQYDAEGVSTVRVPCGHCGREVRFLRDEDEGPIIEVHVVDVEATPQQVCPYSGEGR